MELGHLVGSHDGVSVGNIDDGEMDGTFDGISNVGSNDGISVGCCGDGNFEGISDGILEVGYTVGLNDGKQDGVELGFTDGIDEVGFKLGEPVGCVTVGNLVGYNVLLHVSGTERYSLKLTPSAGEKTQSAIRGGSEL